MYSVLYESMLTWYGRRRPKSPYLHWYAVITLTVLGFLNIGSIVELLVYCDFWWARRLIAWPVAVTVLIGLLLLHLLYFYRGLALLAQRSLARAPWIAPMYGLLSVGIFAYINALLPSHS